MKIKWVFILYLFTIVACRKNENGSTTVPITTGDSSTDALINIHASDGFNFKTDQQVQVNVMVLAPDNLPIANIPVSILDQSIESGGKVLFRGFSDHSGRVSGTVNLPAYYTYVVIDAGYVGIMRNAVATVKKTTLRRKLF